MQYDMICADRVSATKSVAFVLKNESGEVDGVYWMKGVGRQRCNNFAVEAASGDTASDKIQRPRG